MKNITTNIFLTVFVSAAILSCTPKEEKIDFLNVGGNVILTDTKISRLDINNNVNLKVITKEGVTANSITIFKNGATAPANPVIIGAKIGDATIATGTATFNSSGLTTYPQFASNLATSTGNITLVLQSTYSDGTTVTNPYTIAVARGINWRVLNADGAVVDRTASTDLAATANYLDSTPGINLLKYKTYTKYPATTVISSVNLEWKKNTTGTYAPVAGTLPTTSGTIDLGNIPYTSYGLAVGDVLYYRLSVVSGTHTDIITAKVTIL